MMRNERENKLRESLTVPVELPRIVDEKVNGAYEQIRERIAEGEEGNRMEGDRIGVVRERQKRKYGSSGRLAVAAAAVALLVGTPAIVLAATGFFNREARLEEDTLTYEFEINYELQPGQFDVTAGYTPEGYVDRGDGKYWTVDGNMGYSLIPVYNTAELDRISGQIQTNRVAGVEHTVLSGLEADIITYEEADKYEAPTRIFLFNAMEGYVMEVWGAYGTPLDELVKVADNLTITRTGTDQYETAEEKKAQEEAGSFTERMTAAEENLIPMGETSTKESGDGSRISFTVLEAVFSDTLGEADRAYFNGYEELADWLEEDGSLRPYTRLTYDENGGVVAEESVGQCFLRVKVRAERGASAEKEGTDAIDGNEFALDACLRRLGEKESGSYILHYLHENSGALPSEHYDLQTDARCIWLNAPDPGREGQFFYRSMEEGDSLEYEMIFVVDGDVPRDKLVLDFNHFENYYTEGVYFKLK